MKVVSANLENGLLLIELMREVPEQLRPRRIEIGAPAGALSAQDNRPKEIDQDPDRKVA